MTYLFLQSNFLRVFSNHTNYFLQLLKFELNIKSYTLVVQKSFLHSKQFSKRRVLLFSFETNFTKNRYSKYKGETDAIIYSI